jgi:hypothetical protein
MLDDDSIITEFRNQNQKLMELYLILLFSFVQYEGGVVQATN